MGIWKGAECNVCVQLAAFQWSLKCLVSISPLHQKFLMSATPTTTAALLVQGTILVFQNWVHHNHCLLAVCGLCSGSWLTRCLPQAASEDWGEISAIHMRALLSFSGSAIHKMLVDRQYMGVSKRKCIIWGVAFLSDGTVISVDSAGKVQFWDSATGTLVKNHLIANTDVQSIAISDVSIVPVWAVPVQPGAWVEKAVSVVCHRHCSLILNVVVEEDWV